MAAELGHGERQWLEIGMVLLTGPKLLLLDEPTSGMTLGESHRTAELIDRLRRSGRGKRWWWSSTTSTSSGLSATG